ncbi:hypothetical protein LL033_10055 [Clostridium estertheticum]|uniref:hypothetical protein n=1 Tax=Clostridium estertheticum TaxID=238834 RepID=UPI001C0DD59C|nr:hypothetical protein [Clostridium estertheticum]MBU3217810.1 hypothetical protein [Clostridium estertheticum]WAG57498.1 hypothetical protein LL033_10055 [Clostridium estertheticum]
MDYKPNFKIIWLIIFLSPLIVATLVSINIVDIPTSNDWIGFYASIFGGLLSGLLTFYSMYLSMSGVRKQISEQRKANNLLKTQLDNDNKNYIQEQRLHVRPYISEYWGENSNVIECCTHIFEGDPYNYIYTDDMIIKIKNIGIGPLISLRVMGIKGSSSDAEMKDPVNNEIKSLEVNGIMNLKVSYMTETEYMMNTNNIEVQYYDVLDNLYKQVITVHSYRDELGAYQKCKIGSISKQELIINDKNTD